MKIIRQKYNKQAGFTLVELMIVIAVIALIIGIGSVAWGAAVKNGNEVSAIGNLRTIQTAQLGYASKHQGSFAATLKDLVTNAGLDDKFNEGDQPVNNGYVFTMEVIPKSATQPSSFKVNANPQVPNGIQATGNRFFFISNTVSTVKSSDAGPAKETDPSI